jgi:predicted metal-dependent hydrolase
MSAEIQVRHPEFDLGHEIPRYWMAGDPFKTHFLNALSSVFPDGEAFFVRSVMHYRDRVEDPELQKAIRGFAGQEAQHSQEHDHHVEMLVDQGYVALTRMNHMARKMMLWANRRAPVHSLANTAALEHLTALLARQMMARPEMWAGEADPRMARMWQWHALEEAEHKAVAFDVYRLVHDGHTQRVIAQVGSTLGLIFETWLRMSYMLWVDGKLFRPRLWMDGVRWLFGRGGILRGFGRDYMRWYRRDFHPNEIDDGPAIEHWRPLVAADLSNPHANPA